MLDVTGASTSRTIAPRTARPVVPIRNQADELLLEHAEAYTRLVQAILATAPNGDFGGTGANHEITDPATDNLIGGGCFPEYVTRVLTDVFNDAADRMAGDAELTALMDAIAEPVPARRMQLIAGGAR